ncbi:MAG: tetratricopeptide repeat protein [Chthoniobacter sp.]
MAEKHWPLAERFFAAAIDAEPTDAKAYYLLAHVRDEMGKPEEAKAAIEEALRLRPNQKQFLELRDKLASPAPK